MTDSADASPVGRRGEIARAVAAAVDRTRNVERSTSLMYSTLHPGGRIDGVVLSAQRVTVHIVIDDSRYGDDLHHIGELARRAAEKALRGLGDERPVTVRIDDLARRAVPAATEAV